jgi:NAD-dependent SIR2 family protein deacetylase
MDKEQLKKVVMWIRHADSILIGAGSGLSADAGADYTDTKDFAEFFPGMVKRGFHMRAELIGYTAWPEALKWGYLAKHLNQIRFELPPAPVYERLLDIVRDREYFVITTNADAMFERNGFDTDRIYTPQGSYALLQYETPCTTQTWPSKPIIDQILPFVDPGAQEVTDESVIPKCPNCGGPISMNVRGGDWFIEEPYLEQAERYDAWLHAHDKEKIVCIEIGAGFNTPVWIRFPMERVIRQNSRARLVRINLAQPGVPEAIAKRSISCRDRAIDAITTIHGELFGNDETNEKLL